MTPLYLYLNKNVSKSISIYKYTYLLQYLYQSPGLLNVEYIGMGIEVAIANIHTVTIIIFACLKINIRAIFIFLMVEITYNKKYYYIVIFDVLSINLGNKFNSFTLGFISFYINLKDEPLKFNLETRFPF